MAPPIECLLEHMLAQAGDRYVFGAETDLADPDPGVFDCSELIQWAAHRCGVTVPDGSQNQRRFVKATSITEGVRTRGALLGSSTHVVASLGNGATIEARGAKYGVGSWPTRNRPWTWAGLIPGFNYAKEEAPMVRPRYDPPLRILGVDFLIPKDGKGVLVLSEDGAVYAWGTQDRGAPNRHPEYWPPRAHPTAKAAKLEHFGETGYTVVASSGERFDYV
jgi:cell wall-associated NlpC family hydrolase